MKTPEITGITIIFMALKRYSMALTPIKVYSNRMTGVGFISVHFLFESFYCACGFHNENIGNTLI